MAIAIKQHGKCLCIVFFHKIKQFLIRQFFHDALIIFTLYGISRRFIQRYNCDVNITLNCTSCKILYKFDRLSTKLVTTTSSKNLWVNGYSSSTKNEKKNRTRSCFLHSENKLNTLKVKTLIIAKKIGQTFAHSFF